ncbi:hypothetical protein PVT71_00635 [Salipiger sp. H15]|uniref:Uncharacterized protein n=1 Tax=Alloyangia sp. H15 TaxID=3029062 RepID=A0AAU8AFM5_9RHOB
MSHSVKEAVAVPAPCGVLDGGEIRDVIAKAYQMQGCGAVSELLRLSAALLEHCAYELARSDSRGQVSRIILISAELERMAGDAALQ